MELEIVNVIFEVIDVECVDLLGRSVWLLTADVLIRLLLVVAVVTSDTLLVVITVTSEGRVRVTAVVILVLVMLTWLTATEEASRSTGGFGGGPLGRRGGKGGGFPEFWFLRRGGFSTGTACVSLAPSNCTDAALVSLVNVSPTKPSSSWRGLGTGRGRRLDNVVVAMRGGTGGGTFFGANCSF